MEIFFIAIIFLIGTVFGSFFTLAVYRIPLGKNITHERSFCPNCNHRLEFKDLIPVFSYIFLRGKCRYCGEKVRPRYLILEILSGIVFVLAYISIKINITDIFYLYLGINNNETIQKLIYLLAFILFYVANALIVGIDKEYKQINKKVFIFGVISQAIYTLYLYIVSGLNMYRYGIYLLLLIGLLIINVKKITNYKFQNILYLIYIITFIKIENLIILVPINFIIFLFNKFVGSNVHSDPQNKKTIPIGFYLGISAITTVLISNFINS